MTRQEDAQELVESLPDDLDVTVEEATDSLDQLVDEYNVPLEEAVRSTRSKYMEDYDGDGQVTQSSPDSSQDESVDIGDLTVDHDEKWVNIQGTVQRMLELSEKQSSWIAQKGVIGDDTGTTLFTIPKDAVEEDAGLELEQGESYELQGVVGDAYNDDISVKVTSTTTADTIDTTFTPPSTTGGSGSDVDVDIADLTVDHDEEWFNIQGTVQRLIDPSKEQASWMAQRGVIGDDTGTTLFTISQRAVDANPDLQVEEGESYAFESVVGDAYNGEISVNITSTSTVETLDSTFTPPDNDTHITGPIVDIQEGSGLIKRCPEDGCTHVVSNGRCREHGQVEGEFDLRLKTVVDDGETPHEVFFGCEATEVLTGISLENAIQIAEDAMDTGEVANQMEKMLIGRYYKIAGNKVGEYALVNQFERVSRDWESDARELLDSFSDNDEVVA